MLCTPGDSPQPSTMPGGEKLPLMLDGGIGGNSGGGGGCRSAGVFSCLDTNGQMDACLIGACYENLGGSTWNIKVKYCGGVRQMRLLRMKGKLEDWRSAQ